MPELTIEHLPSLQAASPAVRVALGAVGMLLLLFGARVYKGAVLLVGFASSALLAVWVVELGAEWLELFSRPEVGIVLPLVSGVAGASMAWAMQRLALVAVGAVLGVAAAGGVVSALGSAAWWGLLIGAVAGAVIVPLSFKPVLRVLTPLCGAVVLLLAAGWEDRPLWGIALAGVGMSFQLLTGSRKKAS